MILIKTRATRQLDFLLAISMIALCCAACQTPQQPAPPPDRLTAILADAIKYSPAMDLLPPLLHHPGWRTPEPAPGLVNSAGLEDSPFITPDGQYMIFFFTPTILIPPERQLLDGVTGLYQTRWEGDGWGLPERILLQDEGQLALDGCGTLRGDQLWFCSARPGNLREIDILYATWGDGRWQDWQNAGQQLNLEYMVGEMHISADGNLMLYHTDRLGGIGGLDLWQIRKDQAGGWLPPENLSTVNTVEDDGWPFLSEDMQELWFTRSYQGSPAIYRSVWTADGWGAPELIVSQFAGEPALDEGGNLYFVHHFIVDGEIKDADIYVAYKQ